MALRDLFKSRSQKFGPDPRVRWFGKLPTYPDYYNSHGDEEWTLEFNDWILKGYELYRSRFPESCRQVDRLPITGCAVRLPKSAMTVFASILDFGGDMRGRPFPMCFYVGVPTAQWPGPPSNGLGAASRAIRTLVAFRREIPRFLNSPGRLEATFGQREVSVDGIDGDSQDESWLNAANSLRLNVWFDGAKPGMNIQDLNAWLPLASNWGDHVASLDSKSFEPTLRFPLAMSSPVEVQVAGWLRWLETRMSLKRRTLTLIISGDPDGGCGQLTIVARDLVPEDFVLFTPLANTLSYLDDLSQIQDKPGSEGVESASERGGGSVTNPEFNGSWGQFVCSPVTVT